MDVNRKGFNLMCLILSGSFKYGVFTFHYSNYYNNPRYIFFSALSQSTDQAYKASPKQAKPKKELSPSYESKGGKNLPVAYS